MTAVEFQRSIRQLVILTLLTFALLVAMGAYFAHQNYVLAKEGQRAHRAVCVLRADEIRRVAEGRAFLVTHPDGFGGVSADEIRASIASQERTIAALAVAECED